MEDIPMKYGKRQSFNYIILQIYKIMISHCYILASSSYGNFNWRALLEWNESGNHYSGYTLDLSSQKCLLLKKCVIVLLKVPFFLHDHIYNLEGETSQQNKEIINMTSDSCAHVHCKNNNC